MASQLTALGDEQASKVSAMEQAHLCELERAISAAAEQLATAVRSHIRYSLKIPAVL